MLDIDAMIIICKYIHIVVDLHRDDHLSTNYDSTILFVVTCYLVYLGVDIGTAATLVWHNPFSNIGWKLLSNCAENNYW